jgi:glucose/mannose-6-phosphate isomerase
MTYEEGILSILEQLQYKPELKGEIKPFKRVIVCGMGGSRLAADMLNMLKPELEILIHSDYGLPNINPAHLREALIIANSYSGNTAETISAAEAAIEQKYNLVIVCGGGELQKMAESHQIPHVVTPHSEMPARLMVYQNLIALSACLKIDPTIFESAQHIDLPNLKKQGADIASRIGNKIPLIYTSTRFNELGYIWKVNFNETAQVSAFHNWLPEIDHNEIAGFHSTGDQFFGIMIGDPSDQILHPRFQATAELLEKAGMQLARFELPGQELVERVIAGSILAHWTALALAEQLKVNPLSSFVIEELKQKLAR